MPASNDDLETSHPFVDDKSSRLVTLDLDDASTAHFQTLRRTHFPSERDRVPAHVMLFHRFDAEHDSTLRRDLTNEAATHSPFDLRVEPPRSIGTGVVYDLVAEELAELHGRLAAAWRPWLVPQDRERFRPHVVVQNKVDGATARATLARLRLAFVPFPVRAIGFRLWTYRSGTWHDPQAFGFAAVRDSY